VLKFVFGATCACLAVASFSANAATIDLDWTGAFTLLEETGLPLSNPSFDGDTGINTDLFSLRSTINGTITFNTASGTGTATVDSFLFSGNLLEVHDFTMQAIGDGMGGSGTLVLSTMLLN